ncbi:hypothetical protein Syun_019341 [Stephania yunnanensis]|uniref:Uncharacterized protein n=1 Tax=Stephania yunnanensis TaxID=152371 RepID=A0AAP0IU07_9MAGN
MWVAKGSIEGFDREGGGEGGGGGAEREGREVDSSEREEDGEGSAPDNGNGWRRERRSVQKERRAARRESKPAEEGRRSVQMRETRMGAERGGRVVGAKRKENGENLQLGVGSEEGFETGEEGEAVGAEEIAERSGEVAGAERGNWRKSLQVSSGGEDGVRTGRGGGRCRGGAWRAEAVGG